MKESEEYSVRVSYVELYNEELYDLLGASDIQQNRLRIFDDPIHKVSDRVGMIIIVNMQGSVVIHGMEEVRVRKCDDVYQVIGNIVESINMKYMLSCYVLVLNDEKRRRH
jgi:kinesin family protein 11